MAWSEADLAEILKRPGVRGAESGERAGSDTRSAQGARRRCEQASDDRDTDAVANVEPITAAKSLGAKKGSAHAPLCYVHVHSLRSRLADPDNISAKAILDGIVQEGILEDDSTDQIKEVRFSQEKCKKGQEKTIITLNWDD